MGTLIINDHVSYVSHYQRVYPITTTIKSPFNQHFPMVFIGFHRVSFQISQSMASKALGRQLG